jgi:ribonucleotide monophosphatase NagD (HAD superfamily)
VLYFDTRKYYKEEDGLVLDVGAYTAALEYATGVKATLMGKPQAEFFNAALCDMEVEAKNVSHCK